MRGAPQSCKRKESSAASDVYKGQLINADGDGTVSTQKQNGFFAKTPRLVVNLLAAATAKHETEITKEPPSAFPKDVDGRQPHKHNSLLGFVSTALAPDTSHPHTAACVFDAAPWDLSLLHI